MADFTIVTYGGGEILYNVFNGIAMLFNGSDGGIVRPIAIISASVGAIIAISKAYFSPPEGIITKYFLPLIALPCFLLTMSTPVKIEDVIKDQSYQVNHVPYLLGKLAEVVSSIGYQTTVAIEKVMHVPNDRSYNQTGFVFGADTALNIHRYAIKNGDLAKNLKRFSKQCVLYDIALGKYSIDDLKKSTDLWCFLREKTSNVRMINYIDPSNGGISGTFLTCKNAVDQMSPLFEKEKNYYAQGDIIKNLPLTFQALTGLQNSQDELISQQLMMNVLSNEYSGSSFATAKAQAQQKSTYLVLGSLASSSLITMRAVLEVLIYIAFIFVVPLAFLPGGVKFLSSWIWLVIWIQLWPPFYAILNYVMQTVANGRANTIFHGLTGNEKGLSFFTSIGLNNLNDDIFALSGYLAASIPFISYAVIQGGVNSFIHLAGSMMTPAHAAATSVASEQISGNYSLGNISYGQMSYANATAMQKNYSPSISSGYLTENSGSESLIHAPNETIVKQANSDLRTSIFSDDSVSQSLQNSFQHAETAMHSKQNSYMESLSSHTRNMADLTEHLGNSQNFSSNISNREAYDTQESARYVMNVAESFGHAHNLSTREGLHQLLGASLGASIPSLSGEVKGSYDMASSRDDVSTAALNIASNEDFQRNFQKIQDFSTGSSVSSLNDQGVRLVEGVTQSLDEVFSTQEQYQNALNEMNQISDTQSWTSSNAQSLKNSLNQEFINWASEKYVHDGGYSKVLDILSDKNPFEKDTLINEFILSHRTASEQLPSFTDPITSYNESFLPPIDRQHELQSLKDHAMKSAQSHELSSGAIRESSDSLNAKFESAQENIVDHFTYSQSALSGHDHLMKRNFNNKNQSSISGNFLSGIDKGDFLINKFQINEAPFWHHGDD